MEIWKEIKGFENEYQISNKGRVKSLSRHWKPKESILIPQKNKYGYLKIQLGKGVGNFKEYKIHRLVATYFVNNPNNYKEVNHLDGNKSNNNDWNLKWCTRSENMSHAFNSNLVSNSGQDNPKSKLKIEDISTIKLLKKEGKTPQEIADIYQVSRQAIYGVLSGKNWKFLNPENNIK